MVGLTAPPACHVPAAMPQRIGQRAMWLGYDIALALVFIATAADLPYRWGASPLAWAAIYGAAVLRFLSVWPDFFRLLSRNWVYLLYPAVCVASVIWSLSRPVSLVAGVQIAMTILVACYLGWRFAPRQLVLMVFSVLFIGSFASVLNLTLGLFGGPHFSAVGGLQGIYANKNTLGHTSLFLILLALTLMLMPRVDVPRPARWLAPLAVGLGAVAVIASKSMTAVVLMPLYLGLLLLLNRRRLPGWMRHGAVAAAVLAVALAPPLLMLAGVDPLAILFDATGKDATLTGRTELWSIAANEIARVPLTGHGFGAFWSAPRFDPQRFEVLRAGATSPSFHNVIADIGVGTGLLGIAAMLTLVIATLRRTRRFWRADGGALAAGCLASVLLPINLSLAEPYLYRQHEFMMAWLVILGVSLLQRPSHFLPRRKETT